MRGNMRVVHDPGADDTCLDTGVPMMHMHARMAASARSKHTAVADMAGVQGHHRKASPRVLWPPKCERLQLVPNWAYIPGTSQFTHIGPLHGRGTTQIS